MISHVKGEGKGSGGKVDLRHVAYGLWLMANGIWLIVSGFQLTPFISPY